MKVEWILYMLMMDNLASTNQQNEGSLSLLLWINVHTDITDIYIYILFWLDWEMQMAFESPTLT